MSSSRCQDLRTARITGMQCLGVNLFCPWTRTAREHTHTHRQTQTRTRTHTRTRPHNFQDTCLAGAARPKLVEDEDHACFRISMEKHEKRDLYLANLQIAGTFSRQNWMGLRWPRPSSLPLGPLQLYCCKNFKCSKKHGSKVQNMERCKT